MFYPDFSIKSQATYASHKPEARDRADTDVQTSDSRKVPAFTLAHAELCKLVEEIVG